ncbi:MAG TPA: hypothetical protein VFB12_14745 [Ktedonobacteraceae bacterium]|nr:hypothetical protein [Ktedonobacteraceae bacterium]
MIIKRGILQSFNPVTYTASVLLFEATSCALTGVPVANHLDGTSALPGALCAILFFDEHNPQDSVIIATFVNGSSGLPTPAPGRLTFVTSYRQVSGDVIAAGATNTYTLTGVSAGIPSGALGVLYKAYFSSASVGAYIQLAPHATADITAYGSIGNITVANSSINGMGLLQLDSAGRIDIKANVGTCTITLYTHGYII